MRRVVYTRRKYMQGGYNIDKIKTNRKVVMLFFVLSIVVSLILSLFSIVYTYNANKLSEENNKKFTNMIERTMENQKTLDNIEKSINDINNSMNNMDDRVRYIHEEVSRSADRSFDVVVTAYDLSVQSCGKSPSHPSYGITATGFNLSGHSRESARAIAVDPDVIPLGSRVRIKFYDKNLSYLNGVYKAVDTGGAIQGNRIDLFFGDTQSIEPSQEALSFGVNRAKLSIL